MVTDRATGERLLEFLEVMRRLRAECAWKSGQTHRSLVRYLLEEAHETAEAIESGDPAHLREELGDLLLQIWFHAVIAEEAGEFTLADVAGDIIAKMRRRNPHVFPPAEVGDMPAEVGLPYAEVGLPYAEVGEMARRGGDEGQPSLDAATINEVWESIKASEKKRESPTDGLPTSLPALLYADKVLDRLSRERGAPVLPPRDAIAPTSADIAPTSADIAATSAGIGERLLRVVAEARTAGVDPEQALRDAVRRLTDPP